MVGRSLGFILMLIAAGLWYWGRQITIVDSEALINSARILYVLAGAVFAVGLGLFLFKKIVIIPGFTIDLSGETPSLNLGPPGFRFTASGVAKKNGIQVPGTHIFLFMSFATRTAIKVAIAWATCWMVKADHGLVWGIGAGLSCLAVLFIIEQALHKTLAPDPSLIKSETDKKAESEKAAEL
jgi:hypothetical protein